MSVFEKAPNRVSHKRVLYLHASRKTKNVIIERGGCGREGNWSFRSNLTQKFWLNFTKNATFFEYCTSTLTPSQNVATCATNERHICSSSVSPPSNSWWVSGLDSFVGGWGRVVRIFSAGVRSSGVLPVRLLRLKVQTTYFEIYVQTCVLPCLNVTKLTECKRLTQRLIKRFVTRKEQM